MDEPKATDALTSAKMIVLTMDVARLAKSSAEIVWSLYTDEQRLALDKHSFITGYAESTVRTSLNVVINEFEARYNLHIDPLRVHEVAKEITARVMGQTE